MTRPLDGFRLFRAGLLALCLFLTVQSASAVTSKWTKAVSGNDPGIKNTPVLNDARLIKVQQIMDRFEEKLGGDRVRFERQNGATEKQRVTMSEGESQRLIDQSEAFFQELAKEGLTREDLQRFRSQMMKTHGANGESVLFGGKAYWDSHYLATERALMLGRAKMVQQAWMETLRDYFKQNPDAVGRIYGEIDIGSWVKMTLGGLSFDADIDFSSLSSDSVINRQLVEMFARNLHSRTATSMVDADALLTAHGQATADVFIGDWGKTFAEMDMLKRTKWKVIKQAKDGSLILDKNGFPTFADRTGEQLFWEDAFRAAEQKGVFKEVDFPQITIDKEPMLSLEMLRHEIHDVQHGPYARGAKLIKVLKYLERSYSVNRKALAAYRNQYPESNPALGNLAEAVIRAKESGNFSAIEKALADFAGEPLHEGNVDSIVRDIEAKAQSAMQDNACRALAFRLQGISRIADEAGRRKAAGALFEALETQLKKGNGASGVDPPQTIVEAAKLAKAYYNGDPTVDAAELERRGKLLHDLLNESCKLDEPTLSRLIGADLYNDLRSYLKKKQNWSDDQIAKFVEGAKKKFPQTVEFATKFTGKVKEFNTEWEKTASGSVLLRSSDFAGNALQVYDAYMSGEDHGRGCVAALYTMGKIKAMGSLPSLGIVEGVWNAYEQGDTGPAIKAVAFYYLPAIGAFWGMGEQLQRLDVVIRDSEFSTALDKMRARCVFSDQGHIIEVKTAKIDFDVPDAAGAEQRANNFADVFMNDKDLGQLWDGLPEFRFWMSLIPREGTSYGYSQGVVNVQNAGDQALKKAGSTWVGKKLGLDKTDVTGYSGKFAQLRKYFPYNDQLKSMLLILENYRTANLPSDTFSSTRAQKLGAFENQIERALWKSLCYTLESSTVSTQDLAALEAKLTDLQLDLSVGDLDLTDTRGRNMGVVSQVKKEIKANSSWTGTNQYNSRFVYERYIAGCEAVKKTKGKIWNLWEDEFGVDVQACERTPMKFLLLGSTHGSPRLMGDPVEDPRIAEACLARHLGRAQAIRQNLADALGRPIDPEQDKEHLQKLGQWGFEWQHLLDDCPEQSTAQGSEAVQAGMKERYKLYQDYLKALRNPPPVYTVTIAGPAAMAPGEKITLSAMLTPAVTGAPPGIVWSDETRQVTLGKGLQTVFTATDPGTYEIRCVVTQVREKAEPAEARHDMVVSEDPTNTILVSIAGPATIAAGDTGAFTAAFSTPDRRAKELAVEATFDWFVDEKPAGAGRELKWEFKKPGAVEIRAELARKTARGREALGQARLMVTVKPAEAEKPVLSVDGPPSAKVGASLTIKARITRTADPVDIEWMEGSALVASGLRWTPDTSKKREYRMTVRAMTGKGKTRQTAATVRYRLNITDSDAPEKPDTTQPPEEQTPPDTMQPPDTTQSTPPGDSTGQSTSSAGTLSWTPASPTVNFPILFTVHFNKQAKKPYYQWRRGDYMNGQGFRDTTKEPKLIGNLPDAGSHKVTCILFDEATPGSPANEGGLAVCTATITVGADKKIAIKGPANPVVGDVLELSIDLPPALQSQIGKYLWRFFPASVDRQTHIGEYNPVTQAPVTRIQLVPYHVGEIKFELNAEGKNHPGDGGWAVSDTITVRAPEVTALVPAGWTRVDEFGAQTFTRTPVRVNPAPGVSYSVMAEVFVQVGPSNSAAAGTAKEPFQTGGFKGELTKSLETATRPPRTFFTGRANATASIRAVGVTISGTVDGANEDLAGTGGTLAKCEAEVQLAYKEMLDIVNGIKVESHEGPEGSLTNEVGEFSVTIQSDTPSILMGEKALISAYAGGGTPPYQFAWSGHDEAGTNAASVTVVGNQPGPRTVEVTASDSKGLTARKTVTVNVGEIKVELAGVPAGPVVVGTPVMLTASILSGERPAAGKYRLQWEPHPEAQFVPFESDAQRNTTVKFKKVEKVRVWVAVLSGEGAVRKTLAESAQAEIEVVAPKLALSMTPEAPSVGEPVTLTVKEEPAVPDDIIGFWWEKKGDALNAGPLQNERSYTLTPKTLQPIVVTVHGKGRQDGANLGEASITITPKAYTVTVSPPKRLGPVPRIWKEGVGLVDAPENAIGTFQDVTVSASITPEPPGQPLRYQWSVTPDGCALTSPFSRDTRANASQKGTYQVTVKISDKDGLVLGTGSGSIAVTVSQDDQKDGAKVKQAADKLAQARTAVAAGRLDEGIGLAGEAAGLDPKNADAPRLQAQWTTEKQQVQQRVNQVRDALRKPDLQEAATHLAVARQLHPKYAPVVEAGAEYDRAVAAEKEKEAAIARLTAEGEALAKQGKLAEAIAKLKEALALKPDGALQKRIDELNALIAKAEKARQLTAEGFEFEKKGDLAKAIAKYREAQALQNDPKVAAHIAELEKKLADLAQATKLVNEGYALEKEGKLSEAIAKYRASLALNNQSGVQKHIAEVEALIVKKAKADEWIAKGFKAEKALNWQEALTCYESAQKEYANPKVDERIKYVKQQMEAAAKQTAAKRVEAEKAAADKAATEAAAAQQAAAQKAAAEKAAADKAAAEKADADALAAKKAKAGELIKNGFQCEQTQKWKEALTCYEAAQKLAPNPKVDDRIAFVKTQIQAAAAKPAAATPVKAPTAPVKSVTATAPANRSLTGVFKATVQAEGQSHVMTMTLQQNGARVTGRLTAAMSDGGSMNEPINATIKDNRLIPDATDGEDGDPGATITISPDRNTLTLNSPEGAIVFKRVN